VIKSEQGDGLPTTLIQRQEPAQSVQESHLDDLHNTSGNSKSNNGYKCNQEHEGLSR
jgi:hypothetical protein